MIPFLVDACNDENPDIRQATVYGLGVCAEHGGSVIKPLVGEVISRLNFVIRHPNALQPDNIMAYDNAVYALGKVCQFHRDSIKSAQVFPVFGYSLVVNSAVYKFAWVYMIDWERSHPDSIEDVILAQGIDATRNHFLSVNALLSSLEIDNHGGLVREHMPGRYAELDQYCWADEFSQQHGGDSNSWALSFERQHGTGGWAFKFQHEQTQMMSVDRMAGANIPSLAAMEQTRMLAHTLAQNTNPKFQNCKFLQFVSKMSHGELTIEDNQVKPASGDWANEYQQQ
ncbi:hypothetical protein Lser_V15G11880 [Lactuca serriola]